ncbi:MAG: ABC transporter permease [Vicinamibacterales bacterium]
MSRQDWWYRQFLRCFPFDFQREYGAEMSDVFHEQRRDARGEGRYAMWTLWTETLQGFARTAPREHLAMLRQDAGYALRTMRRTPVFTAAAILALGLGIGANTAIFSLLNATFLNPLAVREPSRLVSLQLVDRQTPGYTPISTYNFRDLRDQLTVFNGMAAYAFAPARLAGDGDPEQIFGMAVTGEYFRVLGVDAAVGRTFLASEDVARGGHPVVVLSDAAWTRHFGRDPGIAGRTIRLSGHGFTVIGVAPPRFQGTFALFAPDFYVPLSMYDTLVPGTEWYESRRWRWLNVLARLKPGVDLDAARAATAVVANRLEQAYPEINKGRSVTVIPLAQALINPDQHGTFVRTGLLLAALVAMVLLIACANLANLLLARAAARTREIALRLALGAGRGRIVRQLLTESLLLATAGGAVGLLLAAWTQRLLWAARPVQFQQPAMRLEVDGYVLAFTAAASILTGILFGLVPALHVSRADVNTALKESGRQPSAGGRQRFRAALIVGEVALSLFALVVSGLFLRSLWQAQQIEPGFNPDRLAVGNLNLGTAGYSVERAHAFYERLLAELAARPDVAGAAITNRPPLSQGAAYTINVEGRLPPPGAMGFTTGFAEVMPGYFTVMEMPLVTGRDFTAADRRGTPAVAIINEAMGRLHWPDRTPIGQRFDSLVGAAFEVVGIVRDSKYNTIGEGPTPFFYLPTLQQQSLGFGAVNLIVRSRTDAGATLPTVRATLREMDPDVPLANVATMNERLGQALWAPRFIAALVSAFGALATVLAAIGLYGVMAYTVTLRAHEIGLRMALGASRRAILGAVVGQGMALTGVGVVIGVAGALVAARGIGTLLYDVGPTDPVAFIGMPLLLLLVALAACYIPAQRAARVDPLITLRGE